MKKLINKKGFTLIEVVLVLAIGALIFLLAFLAFSQASVNRRDTQRRTDLGRIASQLSNYQSDNNGNLPTNGNFTAFVTQYLGDTSTFKDPQGNAYSASGTATLPSTTNPLKSTANPNIIYRRAYKCNPNASGTMVATLNNNDFAVIMGLEKGSACKDNQ